MPQNSNRDDNKLPRFGNKRMPPEDPNQAPKKGPRFSIYWIYAIIFAVLIGFQFANPFSPNMKEIDQDSFTEMLKKGDILKYTVISNRAKVKVTIKPESLPAYEKDLKTGINGKISKDGPHMYFSIVSGDSFQDDMRKFYSENPTVKNVGKAGSETNI